MTRPIPVDTSIPSLEPVETIAAAGASEPNRPVVPVRLIPSVVLLALLALGSVASGCEMVGAPQQDNPSVVAPVSPTVAPSPTATPSATPVAVPTPSPEAAGVNLTWTAAPVTASMKNAQMTAVAVGPDRFVAVGCTGLVGSSSTGAAWTSLDGADWTDSNVKGGGDACLRGVIYSPEGYLAWGSTTDGRDRAAFWHSDDGSTWTRARAIASFRGRWIASVVHIGDRYVAFSSHDPPETNPTALIWTSPDGLRWSGQSDPMGCDGGQTGDPASLAAIYDALVDGDEIVTIGATSREYVKPADAAYIKPADGAASATGDNLLVAARSPDGRCWTVTYTPVSSWTFDTVLTSNGLVGVGREKDDGVPGHLITASTSVDGSAWSPSTFNPGAPEGTLNHVASGDRGLLAIGPVRNGQPIPDLGDAFEAPENLPPPGTDPSAWWSADGRAWQRTAAPNAPTTLFSDLVAIPGGFLAVGSSPDPSTDSPTAVAWVGR